MKLWLCRYGDEQQNLGYIYDRLNTLRSKAESARTSQLDGMPHGGGFATDRTGALLAQIEELEAEAADIQEQAEIIRHEIEAAVKQISGPRYPDQRAIIRLRYVDLMSWPDVAEALFGDLPRYWDNPDSFLRRTHRLHGEALAALSQIVVPKEGQEMEEKP